MKFKILIIVGILAIAIVVLFLALKEEVKIHNVNEAFALLKENYSADISNNYSVFNITNGWRFEFLKIEGNCSLECIKRYINFEVYKNGSIVRSENSTKITIIENENDALNYVLFRFPEFKNISKCEFEEKLMCHEDVIVEKVNNKWNVTFMNESRGCNNECVIRRYYSFVVEKDGKIAKIGEKEKIITLEDLIGEGEKYPGNMSVFDAARWYKRKEKIIPYLPWNYIYSDAWLPWKGILWGEKTKINKTIYINTNKEKIYLINESTYNILLEKLSTKTINNESDVLEAFGKYLRVFGLGKVRYFTLITKEMRLEKLVEKEDYYSLYEPEEFEKKMRYKIYRENKSWILECEIKNCIGRDRIEGTIKARISEKGGVYILEKNIDVDVNAYVCVIL